MSILRGTNFMVGSKYVSPKNFYVGNCIFILRSWVLFLSEIPLFLELRSSHRTQNMHYKVYHRNNSHSNPLTYKYIKFIPNTVFPHIVAAATIFFFFFEFIKAWKFHIVSSLTFPLCNENLNSFLTRSGNYSVLW